MKPSVSLIPRITKKQIKNRHPLFRTITLLSLIAVLLFHTSSCAVLPFSVADDPFAVLMDREKGLKVLQFADLHLGEEGAAYHNADVARTLEFIDYAIESEAPDFIVLLGDNMMSQGVAGAARIVEIFDRYQIPYTFVFGNHDAELYLPTYSKAEISEYLTSCESPYLRYRSEYVQEDEENRYGNFSVPIRDKSTKRLLGAFVVLDTGVYDYGKSQYQSITEGQIDWYKETLEELNETYTRQWWNPLSTVPTITYGHIQLPEYVDAYRKAKSGDGAEFIYAQELSEQMLDAIASNAGRINYGFFDTMKSMGSAKAYFCGHMHTLTYHAKMDDIVLGFCPQSGVMQRRPSAITTFSYTVNENLKCSSTLSSSRRIDPQF